MLPLIGNNSKQLNEVQNKENWLLIDATREQAWHIVQFGCHFRRKLKKKRGRTLRGCQCAFLCKADVYLWPISPRIISGLPLSLLHCISAAAAQRNTHTNMCTACIHPPSTHTHTPQLWFFFLQSQIHIQHIPYSMTLINNSHPW